MKQKFYKFVPTENRKLFSLNFLLAEKVIVDLKTRNLKSFQSVENCSQLHNRAYFCMLYTKHISRYLNINTGIPQQAIL